MKPIYILLLIFVISGIASCNTYCYTNRQWYENEMSYYGFQQGDTILEFGTHPEQYIPLITARYNKLHWYLTKEKINEGEMNDVIKKVRAKYNNQTYVTYTSVSKTDDIIHLSDTSVDNILCLTNLYFFKDFDKTAAEFHRILKPNGQLVLTQNLFTQNELKAFQQPELVFGKPFPNEESIVTFFTHNGFELTDIKTIVLNKRMQEVLKGRQKMFHFKKVTGISL